MSQVAVYARRSRDPGDQRVSVALQERQGRAYAAREWPDAPVSVYVDNDLTAADPAVTRPGWVALVAAIRAGRVDRVVVREQSRLTRQPAEWEDFCVTCQLAGVKEVHTTTAGVISVAEGSRLPSRLMVVVDAEYVEQTKVRIRLAVDALAEQGRPTGAPGYGYRRSVDEHGRYAWVPHPEHAKVVKRIVREVAKGDSLGLVASRLQADRIPTPRGAEVWHRETIRSIATAPRIIGERVHQGTRTPATWPPLVDRRTWDRAQAALAAGNVRDVNRRNRAVRRTITHGRRYLLTGGLAICGECKVPLIAARQGARGGPAKPAYACPSPTRAKGGCGKVSILAERLEEHVSEVIRAWLKDPDLLAALDAYRAGQEPDRSALRSELEAVESRLAALASRWASGEATDVEYDAARSVLISRRTSLLDELGALSPAIEQATADDLTRAWRKRGVEARRPVIATLARPIEVVRAHHDGKRRSIEERVTVTPAWD